MTRINCVPPSELSRQHLVAEYRELPRLFGLARRAAARGESPEDPRNPRQYTLGKGHVRFFYNKLRWLATRQESLIIEMRSRGYNPSFTEPPDLSCMDPAWLGDWEPSSAALALNRSRIAERLKKSS